MVFIVKPTLQTTLLAQNRLYDFGEGVG